MPKDYGTRHLQSPWDCSCTTTRSVSPPRAGHAVALSVQHPRPPRKAAAQSSQWQWSHQLGLGGTLTATDDGARRCARFYAILRRDVRFYQSSRRGRRWLYATLYPPSTEGLMTLVTKRGAELWCVLWCAVV